MTTKGLEPVTSRWRQRRATIKVHATINNYVFTTHTAWHEMMRR